MKYFNRKKKEKMSDMSEEIKNEELRENEVEQTEEQKQIAELQAKFNEANDKFLRLYSDFENFKKRSTKERIDLLKFAGEDLVKVILPVIDDFERAIKANQTSEDINAVKEGVQLIYNKMHTSLIQKGLEPIVCVGQEFNTDLHEAITNVPAPSDDMKGKVIEEVEKGYYYNGKVLRFAKVIVGS